MKIIPEFSYAFQPIVDIKTRQIYSFEALIRGKDNEPPHMILDQINSKNILKFDQIARNKAITMAAALKLPCFLNLNLFPSSLYSETYLLQTMETCKQQNLDPCKLIIEITEAEAFHETEELHKDVKKSLDTYRELGLKIAIDDFGAGYAGLGLLINFQPDIIKLDKHLIRNINTHGPRQVVIKAIMQVCSSLGIEVIAEGIETVHEFQWLHDQGITLFQGYLFAKPGFEYFPAVQWV